MASRSRKDVYRPFLDLLGVRGASELGPSSCRVYWCLRGEDEVVLKIPQVDNASWGATHIRNEIEFLRGNPDSPVLPRLIETWDYGETLEGVRIAAEVGYRTANRVVALARQYVEGISLESALRCRLPVDQDGFRRGIRDLHERGYAFLDIAERNVVVRPDGSVVLYDGATSVCARDVDSKEFSGLCQYDHRSLDRLFRD